jgi:hypothetical protein
MICLALKDMETISSVVYKTTSLPDTQHISLGTIRQWLVTYHSSVTLLVGQRVSRKRLLTDQWNSHSGKLGNHLQLSQQQSVIFVKI